ncbi:MAG: ATP-binding protein [Pseudomonadota bacterium]
MQLPSTISRPIVSLSLKQRVVLISSIWCAVCVLALGWVLIAQHRASLEDGLRDLQVAQLYSLIGSVSVSEGGTLAGEPNLRDPSFLQVRSGWFWSIHELGNAENVLRSRSLAGEALPRVTPEVVPFNREFLRSFEAPGPFSVPLVVSETEVELANDFIAVFAVSADRGSLDNAVSNYTTQIGTLLIVFALGLIVTNLLLLIFSLRPLDQLKTDIAEIQAGERDRLDDGFPSELLPVTRELNSLIENNRRILDRSRTLVGNLAHGLKTPLAVMMNSTENGAKQNREQLEQMNAQITHYLNRARIAAQHNSVVYRTDVNTVSERLVRVMRKLNPDRSVEFIAPSQNLIFAGEQEDFEEMLGNLLENALKFAKSKTRLMISSAHKQADTILIKIEDDGPGIPAANISDATKRGGRLDESVPGSGLGLSIVNDTVKSYRGSLTFGQSALGGLSVDIELPRLAD